VLANASLNMPVEMHMTHLRTLAAGLGVCVAIGMFACGNGQPGGGSNGPPPVCNGSAAVSSLGAPTMTIQATDNLVFVPDTSSAATGDIIEFKNTGSVVHTVTFQDNNDACLTDNTLAPGATWEVKFTQPGTYNYLCTIHAPNMKGVIKVTGSAAASTPSASVSPGASPSASPTPSPAA
jgi:plastocyanin